jgi:tetratricopeptide (TPR) repeat protein
MGIANSLLDLGELTQRLGDYPSAHALYQEGLAVSQAAGNQWYEGLCLHALGDLSHLQGEAGQGWVLHEQAVRVFRQNGEAPGIALSLGRMAHFVRQQGEHAMANKLHREALAIWNKISRRQEIAECLEMLAADALALGQPPEAARWSARLLGATQALRLAMGDLRIAAVPEQYDRTVAAVRAVLSESAFAAAWTAGRVLPIEQVIAEALQETPAGRSDAPSQEQESPPSFSRGLNL